MKRYTAPKAIIGHPGVKECLSAVDGGADDYRHDVLLKEGWVFTRGRMASCRVGFFKNVADFLDAEPTDA